MDDDISKLLKEAKPLYFARKRRNRNLKSVAAMLLCVLALQMFYDYYTLENEIYLTENGSVIEDMGLPTDEYGLLKVV